MTPFFKLFTYGQRILRYFPVLLILCMLWGCTGQPEKKSQSKTAFSFVDGLGRQIVLKHSPQRVMALAPSMTEMLFAVCDTSQVVAVTQNCDYPAATKTKPVVNNYPMDFEGLLRVKPDLVFTVEGMTSLDDARQMEQMGIPLYYQRYLKVEDIYAGLQTIGQLTGHSTRGKELADSLRKLTTDIEKQTAALPKPAVLVITWPDPIYVHGKNTIMTDKLRISGARNAVDTVFDAPYPALTREYVLKINPDIIIGGSFEKMDSSFFRMYPELKKTNAYRNRRVYAVTDDLNSRPGPRVAEAILELKRIIHPQSGS